MGHLHYFKNFVMAFNAIFKYLVAKCLYGRWQNVFFWVQNRWIFLETLKIFFLEDIGKLLSITKNWDFSSRKRSLHKCDALHLQYINSSRGWHFGTRLSSNLSLHRWKETKSPETASQKRISGTLPLWRLPRTSAPAHYSGCHLTLGVADMK